MTMSGPALAKPWLASVSPREQRAANSPQPITTASIKNLTLGTGHSIYANSILPAISAAHSEIIIVTCFWARSGTLDALNETLLALSRKGQTQQKKIRVRICFSSSSLFQKLFHTTSLSGRTYAPSECNRKLGLPRPEDLKGLDLEIKSIFVLPFSVMHPKFVIVDRATVLLPSCNVSWENWFEGCLELRGEIVDHFVNFWKGFWASDGDRNLKFTSGRAGDSTERRPVAGEITSVFLLSPHHRNPQFALPWNSCPRPPQTPLNTFLLAAFADAKRSIYIQTPNLTSPPVLSALLAALKRGVTVAVVTSERLMILEQLLTAGTTTKRCVKKLVKRHARLMQRRDADSSDVESGLIASPGMLSVQFYSADPRAVDAATEPVQSHIKVTITDEEVVIFGSGNMDRASWYTSQELGVAFFSPDLAAKMRSELDQLLSHRTRTMYTPARR
ncbi:hypothetical protein BDY17DRAFT_281907 [Neohortaea acidophila]|uniref:PLD phosphodiesterase domain-containing protein n=1 Tax=Neohortaea acidophila TaxID=245834 RepID=A0A6A6PSK5_9PEZI|nr:uncharacterized protein BDY17DRAFT_281907 [Neohortaea acidophila]KAF2482766.1 hypothetical protein BDY17DRAFT_281907 [Neohortaea acidophila]